MLARQVGSATNFAIQRRWPIPHLPDCHCVRLLTGDVGGAEIIDGIDQADVILVNEPAGSDGAIAESLRREFTGAVLRASTTPTGDMAWLGEAPILAWAGIGGPERFFNLLASLGADVRIRRRFRDHHPLSDREAAELLQAAQASGTRLVTTSKDLARLKGRGGAAAELARESRVLEVGLTFPPGDADRLDEIVRSALAARRT